MWLAETAVDLETLEILAAHDIKFTILSPMQASRIRPLARGGWTDVRGGRIDPSRAYLCNLPGGEHISVFFYDGPISHAVAFEGLLNDGHAFARRLLSGFTPERSHAQLVHIATDGESYGHHHKFGEMALCRALADIEANPRVRLTNYGEYLERHPPRYEVEIFEASSWSCAHGVGRWSYDCGCHSGAHPNWNQAWRAPLRSAMNWLRDELARTYERDASAYCDDPWLMRNAYIQVILERTRERIDQFLKLHARRPLEPTERVRVLQLLEMQRHSLLMFTSCGWFFDDISGIETIQNLLYAARAMQLHRQLTGIDLEPSFLAKLEPARSNLPEFGNGAQIYLRFVRPAIVELEHVAANVALTAVLEGSLQPTRFHAYEVRPGELCERTLGERIVIVGPLQVRSLATLEQADFMFAAVKLSESDIEARIAPLDPTHLAEFRHQLEEGSCDHELTTGLGRFAEVFSSPPYTLKSLFRDQQRRIVYRQLASPIEQAIATMEQLYDENASLMRFLADLGVPLPNVLKTMTQFVLTNKLVHALQDDSVAVDRLRALLHEARTWKFELDLDALDHAVKCALDRSAETLEHDPNNVTHLARLEGIAQVAFGLPLRTNLWRVQTTFHRIVSANFAVYAARSATDEQARQWVELCRRVAELLRVRLPEQSPPS